MPGDYDSRDGPKFIRGHPSAVGRGDADLAAHRSGAIHIAALSASQEHILVLDGAAIVNVLLEISGTFGGREASGAFRFTRVWAPAAGGQWQVVAAHSTLVADGRA